jgi:hypothetical protein
MTIMTLILKITLVLSALQVTAAIMLLASLALGLNEQFHLWLSTAVLTTLLQTFHYPVSIGEENLNQIDQTLELYLK